MRLYDDLLASRTAALHARREAIEQPLPAVAAPVEPLRLDRDPPPERSVAVIVPCYQHGRYLPDCIASIHAQTLRAAQIIVVDDRSEDPETDAALRRAGGRSRGDGDPAWTSTAVPAPRATARCARSTPPTSCRSTPTTCCCPARSPTWSRSWSRRRPTSASSIRTRSTSATATTTCSRPRTTCTCCSRTTTARRRRCSTGASSTPASPTTRRSCSATRTGTSCSSSRNGASGAPPRTDRRSSTGAAASAG